MQNDVLVKMIGFTIHPTVKSRLPATGIRIAEIATGPGAFLRQIATELPTDSKLDGYDISSSAFPEKSAKLASNISFHVLDAKIPPPAELHSSYDAVFIRYMNIAMAPADWDKVARTAYALLKPGGALQWYESEFRQARKGHGDTPNAQFSAIEEGMKMFLDPLPDLEWPFQHLGGVLAGVGFRDVSDVVVNSNANLELRRPLMALCFGAAKSALSWRMKAGGQHVPADQAALDDLIGRMHADMETGGYCAMNNHVWVAVKP